MKDTLKQLRQSRCLPYLAAALSFLVAWTGETGSLVWGGLCILLSLPLLAAPEYLLVPLLSAVLLDNNCNLLPGLTASRYFTMLFLAVEGLSVLLREKPGQWVRRFAYPVLLILYVLVSAVFVGHCFSLDVFTFGMNIALAVLMAALPSQRRERLWRLLPWSCAAAVSYMLFCLNFHEVEIDSGRYWFLGATNVNGIGMVLAQTAILFFAAMAAQPETRKGEWKAVGCFAGYVVSLYLLILTGARSALLGLVAGCAVLGILLLLRSERGRGRRRQTANLLPVRRPLPDRAAASAARGALAVRCRSPDTAGGGGPTRSDGDAGGYFRTAGNAGGPAGRYSRTAGASQPGGDRCTASGKYRLLLAPHEPLQRALGRVCRPGGDLADPDRALHQAPSSDGERLWQRWQCTANQWKLHQRRA